MRRATDRRKTRTALLAALFSFFHLAGAEAGGDEGLTEPPGPGAAGPSVGRRGMVATSNDHATLAGLRALQSGGNAVDAMATVQFVLTVAEPYASGIGGGCFIMIHDAEREKVVAVDGREEAPAALTPDAFLDDSGEPIPFRRRVTGGQPVGVPGTLAAMAYALERYGTRPLAETLQPAIDLARRGFPVDAAFARNLREHEDRLKRFPSTRELYFDEDGDPIEEGDRFRNPDLADTLERLAKKGTAAFYDGEIGRDLVEAVRNAPFRPGVMKRSDLRRYAPVRRRPVTTTYRGHRLYGMNMPTSGPATVMMALNLLEPFDLARHGRWSPQVLHRLADAQNLAFADRNAYMGDADFADVPVDALLSKAYAARRRQRMEPFASVPTPVEPGKPKKNTPRGEQTDGGGRSTTHVCIVDRDRNVVSVTTTIEQHFGCGMVVPGRGFLLNNELTDFDAQPRNRQGRLKPNAPEGGKQRRRTALGPAAKTKGGKRPRSSMSPMLVFKDGSPYMAVGSPGGSRIIGITLNVLVNVLDFGMDPQAAINAPRAVARNGPVELEPRLHERIDLRAALEARGFDVNEAGPFGAAQAIVIGADGRLYGGADPRRRGVAAGC